MLSDRQFIYTKDYRWSGYAEALAGRKLARLGIQSVVKAFRRGQEESLGKSLETYRMQMVAVGNVQSKGLAADGRPLRAGMDSKQVSETLRRKGKLSLVLLGFWNFGRVAPV